MEVCKLIKFFVVAFIVLLLISEGVSTRKRISRVNNTWKRRNQNYLENCKCGVANEKDEGSKRIINGDDVTPPNRFPWTVSLSRIVDGKKRRHCAGAIISQYAILTAGHCLMPSFSGGKRYTKCVESQYRSQTCWMTPKEISVDFVTEGTSVRNFGEIASLVKHPHLKINNRGSDIALIIMKDPIPCTANTRPICLPTKPNMATPGLTVITAGWGTTNVSTSASTNTLQMARLKLSKKEDCHFYPGFVDFEKSLICVTELSGQGPCFGDSGSPIISKTGGSYYAHGVASFHTSMACRVDEAFIYTDVYYYLPWIKKHMNPNDLRVL